jgi:hypothetical protein
MTVVTINNQKGGVGTTSTAANLGVRLARRVRDVRGVDVIAGAGRDRDEPGRRARSQVIPARRARADPRRLRRCGDRYAAEPRAADRQRARRRRTCGGQRRGRPRCTGSASCARPSDGSGADEVVVSRTVRDLGTGSGIPLRLRGVHEPKDVPEIWELLPSARARRPCRRPTRFATCGEQTALR